MIQYNAALTKKNELLRGHVSDLSQSVAQLEQYARLNNVKIRGVPITKVQDYRAIIKAVGANVNPSGTYTNADSCHTVLTHTPCSIEGKKHQSPLLLTRQEQLCSKG